MRAFFVKRRPRKPRFVLQLELDGELRTWALSDWPSLNPADAVISTVQDTEPLSAGPVETADAIVWDRGGWLCEADPDEGMRRGKLRFELRGYKLRGMWVLGRTKGKWRGRGRGWRASQDWTLVKFPDEHASTEAPRPFSPESVLSGLPVTDATGEKLTAALTTQAKAHGAKRGRAGWETHQPMLPGARSAPFSDPEWCFELRLGGVRVAGARHRKKGQLRDENGDRLDAAFPEVADALGAVPLNGLVIDAELVIVDEAGQPDADALAARAALTNADEIRAASLERPASLHALDLLSAAGLDLRPLPLTVRKTLLRAIIPKVGTLQFADHIEEHGEALWEQAQAALALGCRIEARRLESVYVSGPSDDVMELESASADTAEADSVVVTEPERRAGQTVRLSNTDKVFWPTEGITKGELLAYYREIAPWLLPYMKDRAVVLNRFVDGIEGRSFFQHHAPGAKSSWLRTVRIHTSRRPRDYFIVDDVESLLYLVNLATIPLHGWHSRIHDLDHPDYCVIDVDRSESTFANVVRVSNAVHELCEAAGLPTFPKTSGGDGLHVLIPLHGQLDFEQCRLLATLIARAIEDKMPEVATTQALIDNRGGKVYLDVNVNARGRMLVVPFSARAKPGATVSTPLYWDEVNETLDPKQHTLKTVPARVAKIENPWDGFLTLRPDISSALEHLARIM